MLDVSCNFKICRLEMSKKGIEKKKEKRPKKYEQKSNGMEMSTYLPTNM